MAKLALFDMDSTLIGDDVFPEALGVLEKAKEMGYRLCVVSHNDFAPELVEFFGLEKYFDFVIGIRNATKTYLVKCILNRYLDNVFEEVIHFDDGR